MLLVGFRERRRDGRDVTGWGFDIDHRQAVRGARTIAYVPYVDDRIEKGYTVRMREALAAFGDVVPFSGIRSGGSRRLDWLVLNWTDNDLLDRTTRRVALRKVVKLFARTVLLRLAARRLAFVRHNVFPHATAPGHEAAARRWVDRYERLFDRVLVHSGDAAQRRRHYCPHPLYHRVVAGTSAPDLPARYFVAFGRIVRYKRLERLIADFPAGETLVIAGVIGDAGYVDELAARCPPNVLLRPGPIAEGEAQALVAGSTALLIAHADADTIVSSSFFFAMSVHVPVIAVATPFLRWIRPRLGDRWVVVADDATALCRSLPGFHRAVDDDHAAIEREFGDAVLRAALREAFGFEDRREGRAAA